jgi:glycosyltransferase involved in cell wall biosynthesis
LKMASGKASMLPALPLVSVVMPSLNQARFLDAAIASVLEQDYPHLELIVADGGSTDGSMPVLERWQAKDARLRWFSRPDRGPAHALNDALAQVRGLVVGWLNSDDLYAPGAIARALAVLWASPDCLLAYGRGWHVDGEGALLDEYPTLPPATPVERFADGCFICQPTVFFKRSLHVLLGPLDESLQTAFDFEYWLRAFLAFPERISFVDAVQAYSRLHADCITLRLRRKVAMEGMRVLAQHLGSAPQHWLLTYMNELQAQAPDNLEALDLRGQMEAAINEAAAWLKPQALEDLKVRVGLALPRGDI